MTILQYGQFNALTHTYTSLDHEAHRIFKYVLRIPRMGIIVDRVPPSVIPSHRSP